MWPSYSSIFGHLQRWKLCHPTYTDKKVHQPSVAIRKYDKFSASFTDQVRLVYLDVAIAKNFCKTRMPSCAIDMRQSLFRCSHLKFFFAKLTKKFENLSVKLVKNGRKNISSVKVGVHQMLKTWFFVKVGSIFCQKQNKPLMIGKNA